MEARAVTDGCSKHIQASAGFACSQGWLVLVAPLATSYRAGGEDLGFVMAPLWFGYACGTLAMLVGYLVPRLRVRLSDGAALGAALLGYMLLIVTHSMVGVLGDAAWPVGVAAFVACALAGAGSTALGLAWLERWGSTKGSRVLAWVCAVGVLCCLMPVVSLLGHSVWAPLLNALMVGVSFAGLARFGSCEDERPAEPARGFVGRPLLAGLLLGGVFALMLGQFVGARFGRVTWTVGLFGVAGVLVACGILVATHRVCGRWDLRPACWGVAACMVVAFYPIDAGSWFSLVFALSGAVGALWMMLCVAPVAALRCAAGSVVQLGASLWCGLAFGAGVAGPLGLWIASTAIQGTFVLVSAIVSMVAGFVAMVWVLRPEALEVRAELDEPQDEGALPDVTAVCQRLAIEGGLTPRELEALQVLALGYDVARVQRDLNVSEGTALTHKRHVYQKLGVHTRSELLDLVHERQGEGDEGMRPAN